MCHCAFYENTGIKERILNESIIYQSFCQFQPCTGLRLCFTASSTSRVLLGCYSVVTSSLSAFRTMAGVLWENTDGLFTIPVSFHIFLICLVLNSLTWTTFPPLLSSLFKNVSLQTYDILGHWLRDTSRPRLKRWQLFKSFYSAKKMPAGIFSSDDQINLQNHLRCWYYKKMLFFPFMCLN